MIKWVSGISIFCGRDSSSSANFSSSLEYLDNNNGQGIVQKYKLQQRIRLSIPVPPGSYLYYFPGSVLDLVYGVVANEILPLLYGQ